MAETVECPRCHVAPGVKCDGVRGKRESAHLERHHAVGELLDLPKSKPTSRLQRPSASTAPYSPDREAVVLQRDHFSDYPVTAIESVMFTLRMRSHPVTAENVRLMLEAKANHAPSGESDYPVPTNPEAAA